VASTIRPSSLRVPSQGGAQNGLVGGSNKTIPGGLVMITGKPCGLLPKAKGARSVVYGVAKRRASCTAISIRQRDTMDGLVSNTRRICRGPIQSYPMQDVSA